MTNEDNWYLEDRADERAAYGRPNATKAGVNRTTIRALRVIRHDLAQPINSITVSAQALRMGEMTVLEAAAILEHAATDLARLHRRVED